MRPASCLEDGGQGSRVSETDEYGTLLYLYASSPACRLRVVFRSSSAPLACHLGPRQTQLCDVLQCADGGVMPSRGATRLCEVSNCRWMRCSFVLRKCGMARPAHTFLHMRITPLSTWGTFRCCGSPPIQLDSAIIGLESNSTGNIRYYLTIVLIVLSTTTGILAFTIP